MATAMAPRCRRRCCPFRSGFTLLEPTDEDVDAALRRFAEQQKSFEPAGLDHAAGKGDVVVMDYVGTVDGDCSAGDDPPRRIHRHDRCVGDDQRDRARSGLSGKRGRGCDQRQQGRHAAQRPSQTPVSPHRLSLLHAAPFAP